MKLPDDSKKFHPVISRHRVKRYSREHEPHSFSAQVISEG